MFPNQQQIDRQYTENLHKLCKIIFAATKDCVPVGAGNQKADLAASRGRSAWQVQTVEAFISTSSAKISEGFFQLWILRGRSLISEATIAKY
ncbi:hypothetical protein, partial [Micromonospora sp. NPDC050695]|uniref:hypothetical protein n=1 Tax=Micromonospora sp. NPDC050695 TaxID=3154938 RepID=UPI0034077227